MSSIISIFLFILELQAAAITTRHQVEVTLAAIAMETAFTRLTTALTAVARVLQLLVFVVSAT